jgi:hypothetical protein
MEPTMSRTSRKEFIEMTRWRYARASGRIGKGRLLTAFCAATNYERKYAIKVLGDIGPGLVWERGTGILPVALNVDISRISLRIPTTW